MKIFLTSERSKFPLVHNTIQKIESTVFRIAYWSAPIFSQNSSRLHARTHGNSLSKRRVSIEKEYEEHSGVNTLTWEHGVNTYSSSSTARCWFEMVFQRIVSGKCCCHPTPPPAEPRLCTPPLQSNCRQTESSVRPCSHSRRTSHPSQKGLSPLIHKSTRYTTVRGKLLERMHVKCCRWGNLVKISGLLIVASWCNDSTRG